MQVFHLPLAFKNTAIILHHHNPLLQDRTVFDAIQEGLDRANEHATSDVLKVSIPCSHNTKVSEIVAQQDRTVFDAIQEGLDRANEHATSETHWVGTPSSEQVVQES